MLESLNDTTFTEKYVGPFNIVPQNWVLNVFYSTLLLQIRAIL